MSSEQILRDVFDLVDKEEPEDVRKSAMLTMVSILNFNMKFDTSEPQPLKNQQVFDECDNIVFLKSGIVKFTVGKYDVYFCRKYDESRDADVVRLGTYNRLTNTCYC